MSNTIQVIYSKTNKQFNIVNYVESSGSVLDMEYDLRELWELKYLALSSSERGYDKLIKKHIQEVEVMDLGYSDYLEWIIDLIIKRTKRGTMKNRNR